MQRKHNNNPERNCQAVKSAVSDGDGEQECEESDSNDGEA